MDTTHLWYPLIREWRRTLRVENKAHRTIGNYEETVVLFIVWLDQRPDRPGRRHSHPHQGLAWGTARQVQAVHCCYPLRTPTTVVPLPRRRGRERAASDGRHETAHHPRNAGAADPTRPRPRRTRHVQGTDFVERRDHAIIRRIFDTGCRLSEIAHLKVDDVDLDTDLIHVMGKGRRPRAAPFSSKTGRGTRPLHARPGERKGAR